MEVRGIGNEGSSYLSFGKGVGVGEDRDIEFLEEAELRFGKSCGDLRFGYLVFYLFIEVFVCF